MEAINVDHLTLITLNSANEALAEKMGGDCVFVYSDLFPPLDDEFRVVLEEIKEASDKDTLIVLLETYGGLMETVERLVAVMREHYEEVFFVIPNFAFSAGTVLALSGDKIFMDYYSVLGPIDPQYRSTDGQYLPGHGVLHKYNKIISEINAAKTDAACRAQLAYLIKNFDPAQLFSIEQAIEHGITLITEWLPKYKFKDWKTTQTNGQTVTPEMRSKRAEKIAKILGDASKWHSHGRGIPMNRLMSEEVNLMIDDFGADNELNQFIRHYHGLAVDYLIRKRNMKGCIHSVKGARRVT